MFNCDEAAAYAATSLAFRDRLILEWNRTQQRQTFADSKRVYYLSLEFLMGRALDNAMLNIGQKDVAKGGLSELGFRIEDIISQEHDAALGNGGLGRLAACFLDSLASLNVCYSEAHWRAMRKTNVANFANSVSGMGIRLEIPIRHFQARGM